jgi:hypothetical protein
VAEVSLGDRARVEAKLAGATFETISKKPNEAAAPHHPGTLMYLRVLEGAHIIIVPNRQGTSVELIVLEAGDDIVFADLAPRVKPAAAAVCFAGHASQAGPHGNRFERCVLAATVEELNLKPRA